MIEQAPASPQPLSIEDTFLYTITCSHNNHYDWRLPTHKEVAYYALTNCWRNIDSDDNNDWAKTRWNNWSSRYVCIPVRDKQ